MTKVQRSLNVYQLAAVEDEHMAVLVNAQVGSGKTTVLLEKIAYLRRRNVNLSDMIVLTFTNKAANEIKERLSESTQELLFGTFHSIALRLLQTYLPVEELGYDKEFQVCLPDEELQMAQTVTDTYHLNIKYKNRLKSRMELWLQKKENKYEDDLEQMMHYLSIEKKRQNKMTFEELLTNAAQLLNRYPIQPGWILVDEVQDCDERQLDFLDALKGAETRLFAVGDPNQVIYGWRGSAFAVFYRLKKKYQACEHTLPVNYRSSTMILKAAGGFLQSGTPLIGTGKEGEKIQIRSHYDPFSEAHYLAGKVKELHTKNIPYREIGIFYRLQKQSQILQQVFDREQIPYEISQRISFLEIPVIRWLYDVCRYLVNEGDMFALQRILTDKRYGDHLSIAAFQKRWKNENFQDVPLFAAIEQLFSEGEMKQPLTRRWTERFCQMINLKERIGYTTAAYEEEKRLAERYFASLLHFAEQNRHPCALDTIRYFLNDASLYGLEYSGEDTKGETDRVRLMTLHASKGLEFSHVFLTGVNQGLIPLASQKEEMNEEEQRLLFVGMTRAKEYLELSYYSGSSYPGVLQGPSPYLRMIRSELVEQPLEEVRNQKEAAAHLQSMKRMIQKEKETVLIRERESLPQNAKKRIFHEKYGYGYLQKEEGDMLHFLFDDFGEKQMLALFTNFTIIEE